jgi:hypothetical protein
MKLIIPVKGSLVWVKGRVNTLKHSTGKVDMSGSLICTGLKKSTRSYAETWQVAIQVIYTEGPNKGNTYIVPPDWNKDNVLSSIFDKPIQIAEESSIKIVEGSYKAPKPYFAMLLPRCNTLPKEPFKYFS